MAFTTRVSYGASGQTLTITLTSLADGNSRESTVVDNTSVRAIDALLLVKTKTTGAAGTNSAIEVYAYGTVDGGTTYPDRVTGTDAAITLDAPTQLIRVGTISTPGTAVAYFSRPMSIASAFGGILPAKWGVVIKNVSGSTLSATAGDHSVMYQTVSLIME